SFSHRLSFSRAIAMSSKLKIILSFNIVATTVDGNSSAIFVTRIESTILTFLVGRVFVDFLPFWAIPIALEVINRIKEMIFTNFISFLYNFKDYILFSTHLISFVKF